MIPIFNGLESADHRHTLESVRDMYETPPHIVGAIDYKRLRQRRQTARYVKQVADGFTVMLVPGHSTYDEKVRDEYYRMVSDTPVAHALSFPEDTKEPEDERIITMLPNGSDVAAVKALLESRGSVALEYRDGDDSRIPALLRSYRDGFTVSLAQPDLAIAHRNGFDAVVTTLWLNPGRYGEVHFWDGGAYHRSKDKEVFIHRHGPFIEQAGFDMDLVSKHDTREMVRMAAWSLLEWAAHLTSMGQTSDVSPESDSDESENAALASVTKFPDRVKRHDATTPVKMAHQRPKIPLPVFSSEEVTVLSEDGSTVTSRAILTTVVDPIRACDSCFLSSTCPSFQAGASCAYNFPVEVRTDDQVKALMSSMVEVQAARVAFARFAEELNGGYPDPVVSIEMDRLMRMTDRINKASERRERLTVSVEAESTGSMDQAGGVLSRLFGDRAPSQSPEPMVIPAYEQETSDT